MKREDWANLATFATIAEAGSFTRAAAQLGVSASALSHAMRSLESELGVRLLNRTTRSIAPTEAGERLLVALRPAMEAVAGALAHIETQRARPAGRLRISAHRTAATECVMPRLPRFSQRYPDISVELSIDDGIIDIVANRFDAGIRHEQMLDQGMVSVRISPAQPTAIVASPGYFAAFGKPDTPDDLKRHRCLGYRYTSSGTVHRWVFTREGQSFTIDPPACFIANDVDVLVTAAIGGLGIGCILQSQALRHEEAGSLVRVLQAWCPTVPPNYLYYPGRRHMSTALRAFIDMMTSPDA